MGQTSIIVGIILFAACTIIFLWQAYENKRLAGQWLSSIDKNTILHLTKFTWLRTLQLALIMFCLTVVIIAYDWQLRTIRQNLTSSHTTQSSLENSYKKQLEEKDSQIKFLQDIVRRIPPQQPNQTHASVVSSPTAPTESSNTTSNVDSYSQSTIEPLKNIEPINQSRLVTELYNSEDNSPNSNITFNLDKMKRRYEDILVIYFFLKRCGKADSTDYHIITSALSQEIASLNAPGRMQNDILTAAQGSYKEVYSNTRCDTEEMQKLYEQYITYIDVLSKNFIAQ